MAPTWSKLLRKFTEQISPQNVVLAGSLLAASVGTYKAVTWTKGATLRLGQDLHLHVPEKTEKKDKANVDAKFFRKAQKFRFAVGKSLTPKGKSIKPDDLMGTGFLILIAFSLVARTYCDVWMMSNTTVIERDIISRDTRAFVKDIFSFLYAMPLISLTNQLLKYGINELKLRFRSRLTLYLQSQYLRYMLKLTQS